MGDFTVWYEKKCLTNRFSLIELVFVMVVVAIGFIGISSTMSVGLDSSRGAIDKSIGMDAGEQFVNLISQRVKEDWTLLEMIPAKKPIGDDSVMDSSTVLGWSDEPIFETDTVTIKYVTEDPDESFNRVLHNRGVFLYELQAGSQESHLLSIRTWKDLSRLENNGAAATVHVEVSFPAQKPYTERNKQAFSLELVQPPEIEITALP